MNAVRILFMLAFCAVADSARAQGIVGGLAVDSATGASLPCVDVSLEDANERLVVRGRSRESGEYRRRE